jgi:hypothetical protein
MSDLSKVVLTQTCIFCLSNVIGQTNKRVIQVAHDLQQIYLLAYVNLHGMCTWAVSGIRVAGHVYTFTEIDLDVKTGKSILAKKMSWKICLV